MKLFKMRHSVVTALILTAVAGPASAALKIADFTGGVLGPTGGATFNGMNGNALNMSGGSFVFDDALIPGSGTGFVNVPFGVSTNDGFSFFAGTTFTRNLGNLNSGGVAAIQYNNGQFWGFVFQSDFVSGGQTYLLNMAGGTWDITNKATGAYAASGYVTIGNAGLSNVRAYVAPTQPGAVPEPATWAMMIGGFGAIGGAMRYRRRKFSVSFA